MLFPFSKFPILVQLTRVGQTNCGVGGRPIRRRNRFITTEARLQSMPSNGLLSLLHPVTRNTPRAAPERSFGDLAGEFRRPTSPTWRAEMRHVDAVAPVPFRAEGKSTGASNAPRRTKSKNVDFLARRFGRRRVVRRGVCQIALGDRFTARAGSAENRMGRWDRSPTECADQKPVD